jgi:hypothetical protein
MVLLACAKDDEGETVTVTITRRVAQSTMQRSVKERL